MADKNRYFKTARSDVTHLRRAFYEAQAEAIALYPRVIREKDARITIFAKCINVALCADFGLGFFISEMLDACPE